VQDNADDVDAGLAKTRDELEALEFRENLGQDRAPVLFGIHGLKQDESQHLLDFIISAFKARMVDAPGYGASPHAPTGGLCDGTNARYIDAISAFSNVKHDLSLVAVLTAMASRIGFLQRRVPFMPEPPARIAFARTTMSWNGDDGQENKREDIADLLAEDGHHAALNYDDCERALRTWYANVCRSDHGIAFPNSAEDCVDSDDVPAHARAWRADMDSTTSDETTSSSCADIPPGCRRINAHVTHPLHTGDSIMTESPPSGPAETYFTDSHAVE